MGLFLSEPENGAGTFPKAAKVEVIVEEQFVTLNQSRIKLEQSLEEIVENGRLLEAPFAYFLGHYEQVRVGSDKKAFEELKQGPPFLRVQRNGDQLFEQMLSNAGDNSAAPAPTFLQIHFFSY